MPGSRDKMSLSSAPQHPWTSPKALWWEGDRRVPGKKEGEEWDRGPVVRILREGGQTSGHGAGQA